MTLLISAEELRGRLALTLDEAINVTERLYADGAESSRIGQAPVRVHIPNGTLRVLAGAALDKGIMGGRMTGASKLSSSGAGPTLLFSSETGELLAIVPSMAVLRTGATMGAATRLLAPPSSKVAAFLGTGRNAMSCLLGMTSVCELDEVRVFGRNEARRVEFAQEAAERSGVAVRAVASSDEAVDGADIVTCLTNAKGPVFDHERLAPHAYVNAFGTVCEVPDQTYLDARAIFTGSVQQEWQTHLYESVGPESLRHVLVELVREGRLRQEEIRDLGAATGRDWRRPAGQIVFKESRGGLGDIALALAVYERAKELGCGTTVDLD